MSMRGAMSLLQSIDDNEDGICGFLCDDNGTSSMSDSANWLHPWDVPIGFSNALPDGTPGLASGAAVQLENEPDRLWPGFDGPLIGDPALKNGATGNSDTSVHSNDGVLASVLGSTSDDAFPGAGPRDDEFAGSNNDQDTTTFVCIDNGMGPGLPTSVKDPGASWPNGDSQHQSGSTSASQDCGSPDTEAVTCAHAIVDELRQLLSSTDNSAEQGTPIAKISDILEGISSRNDDLSDTNCKLFEALGEDLDHFPGGGREFASHLLGAGSIGEDRTAETGWHVFGHELLP